MVTEEKNNDVVEVVNEVSQENLTETPSFATSG